jgi:predicted anti-sigma-YlaC factor YlaD
MLVLAVIAAGWLSTGCSVKKIAVNKIADALAGGGTSFASDNDPELIKAALPFSLKLMESLLAESPRHQGLLLAAASGFTQYAYGFVQQEADETEDRDFAAAQAMRQRARRLYLRARDYGLRGLEVRHRAFEEQLRRNAQEALRGLKKEDVPYLYWTAAPWAAATSILKDDPGLIADLGIVEAMMDRALALQEDFDAGALHSFFITYEMSRLGVEGDPAVRSKKHFERALELSGRQLAGPLVAYAEAVSIQKQDLALFKSLLDQALAIDSDARPEWRLANLIAQRRARWLISKTGDLFLLPEKMQMGARQQ